VRCDECQTEPVTPGHYCECCGRKLSLQERRALETAMLAPVAVHAAHASFDRDDRLVGVHFIAQATVDPVPAVHVAAHALVDPILEAHFAGHAPVEPAPAVHVAAHEPVEAALIAPVAARVPVEAAVADVPAAYPDSDAPADRCEICGAPAQDEDLCAACQRAYHSLLDSKAFPLPAEAAIAVPEVAPAVVVASEVSASAGETPAEPAAVISAEVAAPGFASPAVEVATAPPSLPKPPRLVKRVAPVAAAMVPPSRQPSRARTIAAAAAVVVVVAAIGFPLGKLWLGHQEAVPIVREEQPTPPVKQAAAPERAVTPPSVVHVAATTSRAESPVQAPRKAATVPPVPPKAGVAPRTAAARVPSKTARQSNASARPAAAVVVPSPVTVAPAPVVAAPAPVVAPEPKPEPPAAPIGPFFELRDVNETPRVATRIEPQVPDDLRDRSLNEVVIVRVLVTQAGHPLIVSLLRRSKAGPSLDNAIVAAVKQWRFVPARKRGEAVSCWYHVGVPVAR
jgi:periplasmic protein TonB